MIDFGLKCVCSLKMSKNEQLMTFYYLSLVACILYFLTLPAILKIFNSLPKY